MDFLFYAIKAGKGILWRQCNLLTKHETSKHRVHGELLLKPRLVTDKVHDSESANRNYSVQLVIF